LSDASQPWGGVSDVAPDRPQAATEIAGGHTRAALDAAFAFFFEHGSQAYYVYDPETLRFLAVNDAALTRYGYTRAEFLELSLLDIRPSEDIPVFLKSMSEPAARSNLGRFRHRTRDGRVIPVVITANDIVIDGRDARLIEAADISDQVRAELALSESEERFRSVAENLAEGLLLVDLTGVIQYANPKSREIFGVPRESLPGQDIRQFMTSERRAWADDGLRDSAGGRSAVLEDQVVRRDGSLLWVRVHAAPFRAPDGAVLGTVMTFSDISEWRRAEEGTRRSLSLLQATLESTADGILVVDRRGTVQSWNERFLEMWRIPAPLIAARDDRVLVEYICSQVLDPRAFLVKVEHLYSTVPYEVSFDVIECNDGRVFERYSQPQYLDDEIVGRVWSFRDITERKRVEAQMLQSQKMEAIGLLAGGVAHDFNNVLTAILGSAELGLLDAEAGSAVQAELEEIRRAAMNAAALTRQLLLFSRKRERVASALNLNALVRSAERMLRRVLPEDLSLRFEYDDSLGDVVADPGEMEQVLMNLVVNARDACEHGGSIVVSTTRREVPSPAQESGAPPARLARLRVQDTGAGMPPEVRKRVFEPFFTTKGPGKGTGLGMPAVLSIVTRSGGTIEIDSTEGRGSTVDVLLPETGTAAGRASWQPRTERTTERMAGAVILLVEDAPALRRSTRRMLEQRGYVVRDAADALEALELLQREGPDGFQLVLSDVVMPRMGGRELAAELRRRWPALKILLMTGYDDGRAAEEGAVRDPVLAKPFSMEELHAAVREVLG
jgi:PAS domain S-box-containing protein